MGDHRQPEMPAITVLQLFTYAQAMRRVPYLRSVVRSQRQHWLDLQQAHIQLRRLDSRPGRLDRHGIIYRQDLVRQAEAAGEWLQETLDELFDLGIYSIDPACGIVMMPFAAGNDLAWFVFDLFSPRGIDAWRFDTDPIEVRRPLHQPKSAG